MTWPRAWLAHPLTKGLSVDDPRTTDARRRIILEKPFLRRIYSEWYDQIRAALPPGPGAVLEIGSGGGFLKQCYPELVASDILLVPGVDVVLNGTALPFRDRSLRAIVMTNVLHHIGTPRSFIAEALRCVLEGGRIICVEPWFSPWAAFVMRIVKHEPFDPHAEAWGFDGDRPLSDSNGALPWIMFERDRALFCREFPEWDIEISRRGMPFGYLLSGGVSSRISAPGWSFPFFQYLDKLVADRTRRLDMFATIILTRRVHQDVAGTSK